MTETDMAYLTGDYIISFNLVLPFYVSPHVPPYEIVNMSCSTRFSLIFVVASAQL